MGLRTFMPNLECVEKVAVQITSRKKRELYSSERRLFVPFYVGGSSHGYNEVHTHNSQYPPTCFRAARADALHQIGAGATLAGE